MRTILVPTDGSATSEKALQIAIDLAEKHGARLVLLHVLLRDKEPEELLRVPELAAAGADLKETLQKLQDEPVPIRSAEDVMGHPEIADHPVPLGVLSRIGEHVLRRAKHQTEERDVTASVLDLRDGASPARVIVAAARETGADTIVMGTRGLAQAQAVAFGSVSLEVCRTAACTCIAVH